MIKNITREKNEAVGREEDVTGQERGQVSSSTTYIYLCNFYYNLFYTAQSYYF